MPELIDRNELRRRIYERFGQYSTKVIATVEEGKIIEDWAFLEPFLNAAPTIEAEPVKRGKWMNTNETVWDAKEIDGEQKLEISIVSARCSVCNRWAEQVNNFPPYMKYDVCPHCGAKMQDGGAENG